MENKGRSGVKNNIEVFVDRYVDNVGLLLTEELNQLNLNDNVNKEATTEFCIIEPDKKENNKSFNTKN